jgi:hypothetical protein
MLVDKSVDHAPKPGNPSLRHLTSLIIYKVKIYRIKKQNFEFQKVKISRSKYRDLKSRFLSFEKSKFRDLKMFVDGKNCPNQW